MRATAIADAGASAPEGRRKGARRWLAGALAGAGPPEARWNGAGPPEPRWNGAGPPEPRWNGAGPPEARWNGAGPPEARWNGARRWLNVALAAAAAASITGCSNASAPPGPRATVTVPVPPPTVTALDAVGCLTQRRCVAAEVVSGGSGGQPTSSIGFELYDGRSWSRMPARVPAGSPTIDALDCVTATFCMAVGASGSGPMAMYWDGTVWSVVPVTGDPGGLLEDLDCVSAALCYSVGFDGRGPLTLTWNGRTWSLWANPLRGTKADEGDSLTGISCSGAGACIAVGSIGVGGADQPLVESLARHSWSVVRSPVLPVSLSSPGGTLDDVGCRSAISCVAVGHEGGEVLTEAYGGGRWAATGTRSAPNAGTYGPFRLSCAGGAWCMAAGTHLVSSGVPYFQMWDGTNWSPVGAPGLGGAAPAGTIASISCASRSFCLATGSRSADQVLPGAPLLERWNGTAWSVASPP